MPTMNQERSLNFSRRNSNLWIYPWLGLLIGTGAALMVVHPISMVVQNQHDALFHQTSFRLGQIFFDSFTPQFLPMKLLYAIPKCILGLFLGIIFRRLKENRLRLETLHQDSEHSRIISYYD